MLLTQQGDGFPHGDLGACLDQVAQDHPVRLGRDVDDGLLRLDGGDGVCRAEDRVLGDRPLGEDRLGRVRRDLGHAQEPGHLSLP